ncbi:MAG: asparagine synthase [Deltaproteobacteria bacterium]|nr:asparagine synthase [Deltaproteobacteria bacterium]
MTNDYLCVHRNRCHFDSRGFEQDGQRWHRKGITIECGPEESFLICRPRFSADPLFYSLTPHALIVSPNWLTALGFLKEYGVKPSLDLQYVRDYLAFQCPLTSATICREIAFVRNGECVRLNNDQEYRYFVHYPSEIPATRTFEIPDLEKTLKQQLADTDCDRAFFHLSSGLDSSILAILAAEINPGIQVSVATCQTRGQGSSDEIDVVRRLASAYGFRLRVFDFTTIDVLKSGRELIETVLGSPIGHPSHLIRFLLDRQIARYTTDIVTGRGADESLAGYQWHGSEYADPTSHRKRVRVTPDTVLRQLFPNDPESAAAYMPQDQEMGDGSEELTLRQRLQYDFLTIYEAWNIIDQALATALNVNVYNPFLDQNLLESLSVLPDHFLLRNGEQKWLLRETFRRRYPDYVLSSPKRGLRLDLQPYWGDFTPQELLDLLYNDSAFGKRYLAESACERLIHGTLDGTVNFGWQLWSLYLSSIAYELLNSEG